MKRPWMPLYVGDFVADTTHLSAEETGAYILLIIHYWLREGLPQQQLTLSRVARVSLKKWKTIEPQIRPLFGPNWSHKRVDEELVKSKKISALRSEAVSHRGKPRLVQ